MKSGIYRHYKGGLYQCLGLAAHSETNERLVVYVSLTGAHLPGPRLRVRPLNGPEGWDDPVPSGANSLGPRFEYVGDEVVLDPIVPKHGNGSESEALSRL